MIKVVGNGDFSKANKFFEKMLEKVSAGNLDKYGKEGVAALAASTPRDSGKTAESWRYEIERTDGSTKIVWINDNVNDGVNIAIILQYGHGTGSGYYVEGVDYINPAMKPVFDKIANKVWKEVSD